MRPEPRIRVSAILRWHGRILLCRHEKRGVDHWLLPGGGVRSGESLTQALQRELAEETGLVNEGDELPVEGPVAIVDSISPERSLWSKHVVHIVFAAKLNGSLADVVSHDEAVRGHRLFELHELEGWRCIHPSGGSCAGSSPATPAFTSGRCGRRRRRACLGRLFQRPRPRRPGNGLGGRTRPGRSCAPTTCAGSRASGWQAALDHGVRRLVDLRFADEQPWTNSPPAEIDVVEVSLFGVHEPQVQRAFDERVRDAADVASVFAAGYIRALEANAEQVATAVAAVADTEPAYAVAIHCFAGKDRTGHRLGAPARGRRRARRRVAADYAASEPNMERLFGGWISTAGSETERELRRRLVQAPYATMIAVLCWLQERRGGAAGYLRDVGLTEAQVRQIRTRLVER